MEKEHKRQTHTNCVFIAMALAFPCLCCVPCACAMCALSMPLDDDVSVPPRKHAGGQVQSPPGVLAWVGGVAWRCARVGLLYIS